MLALQLSVTHLHLNELKCTQVYIYSCLFITYYIRHITIASNPTELSKLHVGGFHLVKHGFQVAYYLQKAGKVAGKCGIAYQRRCNINVHACFPAFSKQGVTLGWWLNRLRVTGEGSRRQHSKVKDSWHEGKKKGDREGDRTKTERGVSRLVQWWASERKDLLWEETERQPGKERDEPVDVFGKWCNCQWVCAQELLLLKLGCVWSLVMQLA